MNPTAHHLLQLCARAEGWDVDYLGESCILLSQDGVQINLYFGRDGYLVGASRAYRQAGGTWSMLHADNLGTLTRNKRDTVVGWLDGTK